MFQRIRKHLTPSTAIAFLALVFALTGGAFAASSHSGGSSGGSHATLTASASKAKAKAKAGPRGPAGAKGATGAAGPAGPAGPQGPAAAAGGKGETGTAGANGTDGADGTDGTSGTSATTETFTGSKHNCPLGGVVVKSASPEAAVCNGKTGYTEFLPAGKTETGTWAAGEGPAHIDYVPLSFAIPIEGAGAITEKHFVKWEETVPGKCEGNVHEPAAAPGVLCVYAQENLLHVAEPPTILNSNGGEGALGGPGAILAIQLENSEGTGLGSYAVTAPE
jgi:hypothetical protein